MGPILGLRTRVKLETLLVARSFESQIPLGRGIGPRNSTIIGESKGRNPPIPMMRLKTI